MAWIGSIGKFKGIFFKKRPSPEEMETYTEIVSGKCPSCRGQMNGVIDTATELFTYRCEVCKTIWQAKDGGVLSIETDGGCLAIWRESVACGLSRRE